MVRRFNDWFDTLPEPRRFLTAIAMITSWALLGWTGAAAKAAGLDALGSWLYVGSSAALLAVGIICFDRLERISR